MNIADYVNGDSATVLHLDKEILIRFLQHTIQQVDAGWFSIDAGGKILSLSENINTLTGQDTTQAIGHHFSEFIHPEDKEAVTERFRLLLEGNMQTAQYRISLNKKDYIYVRTSSFPEHEQGRIVAIHGLLFITDIRKRTQESARLQKLVYHLPVLVNAIDEHGEFVIWNRQCEEVTGYSAQEATGNPGILEKLYPDPEIFEELNRDLESGKDYKDFVLPLKSKSGLTRMISWTKVSSQFPIPGWKEWAVGIDITDQIQYRQKLIEQERLFQSVFTLSNDGMVLSDVEGYIFEINPVAVNMLGFKSAEDVTGKNIFEILDIAYEEVVPQPPEKMRDQVSKTSFQARVQQASRTLELNLAPAFDHEGNPWYLAFTVRDVSEKLKSEQELRAALARAEASDRLKTSFLTNMSHEIRTPLNAIVGFANILASQDISKEEKEEFAAYIDQSSETLLKLINDILDVSKIESGEIKLHPENIEVISFIHDLVPLFEQIRNRFDKLNLEIRFDNQSDQKEAFIYVDKTRFQQILSNLVTNAIKFTQRGQITLSVETDKQEVLIKVSDTGPGIAKEEQKFIFDRFRQVDDSLTRKSGGAGLGLSISKNLVELFGGRIGVESEVGRGSLFWFTIPLQTLPKGLQDSLKDNPANTHFHFNWTGKSILVAEDEDANFIYLEQVLNRTGIQIIHAKNGREAIDIFQSGKIPDIVVLDLKMPEMDGFTVLSSIRQNFDGLPVVALTAFAMSDEKNKCLEAGFNSYLAKPVKPHDLLNLLAEYLS